MRKPKGYAAGETRQFNGELFQFDSHHGHKQDAQWRRDKLLRRGWYVRVVKVGSWWVVYMRK